MKQTIEDADYYSREYHYRGRVLKKAAALTHYVQYSDFLADMILMGHRGR